jgi:hypothetical protein
MKKRLLIACVFFLIGATAAFADPVDTSASRGFDLTSFVALIAEALVVSALLARRRFRFFRVFVAWLFVTGMTYWYMQGAMNLGGVIGWDFRYDVSYWLWLLVIETLVVLIEAWIIMRLSEGKFFQESKIALSRKTALAVSTAGNAVSLAISLHWIFL